MGPSLKTFRSLQIEYDLTSRDYYTYLQITHFLCSFPMTVITLPWNINQFYSNINTRIKGVSLFYKMLNNKEVYTKTSAMLAWERELGVSYTPDHWQKAPRMTYMATRSVNLWELTQKILLRWYLTPYRIAKFVLHSSTLCWRNCGQVGTLYHTLWSCRVITQYWKAVFHLLKQILKIHINVSPDLALLSLNIETIPTESRTIATHILLSAKLVLTRHWKKQTAPIIQEVISTTHTHAVYEMMFASTQNWLPVAERQWKTWMVWYKRHIWKW